MNEPQAMRPLEPRGRHWRLAPGALVMDRLGRGRRLLVAPAVISIALVVAACGGGSPQAGVASLGTTTTAVAARTATTGGLSPTIAAELVKYARCMRSHGILNFPDDPGSAGFNAAMAALKRSGASPEFQAAAQACAKYALPRTPPPQITTQDQADYLKAADCMRNHGIVGFPDPVFSSGNINFPIPQGMSTTSTQFRRAREICEMLIPAGLPYSKEAEDGQ